MTLTGRDILAALRSGSLPWQDGNRFSIAETIACGTGALAAVAVGAATVLVAHTHTQRAMAIVGCCALAAYLGPEVWVALTDRRAGSRLEQTRPRTRTPALVLTVGCALAVHWSAALAMCVPVGIDAAVTMSAVGVTGIRFSTSARYVLNEYVVGAAGGLVVVSWLGRPDPPVALWIASIALGGFVIAVAVSALAQTLMRQTTERAVAAVRSQQRDDARYFAGWLHDQASNPVRLLRLRLVDGSLERQSIVDELDRLETLLRDGQVDHLVESGFALLRDCVQPYLRLAERHNVDVLDVPPNDLASLPLPTTEARLASRTLGVLVNNALQAGAKTLSIRATRDGQDLVLSVEDDAGGFQPSPSHGGRGLDELTATLGGRLELRPTATGTVASARITLP